MLSAHIDIALDNIKKEKEFSDENFLGKSFTEIDIRYMNNLVHEYITYLYGKHPAGNRLEYSNQQKKYKQKMLLTEMNQYEIATYLYLRNITLNKYLNLQISNTPDFSTPDNLKFALDIDPKIERQVSAEYSIESLEISFAKLIELNLWNISHAVTILSQYIPSYNNLDITKLPLIFKIIKILSKNNFLELNYKIFEKQNLQIDLFRLVEFLKVQNDFLHAYFNLSKELQGDLLSMKKIKNELIQLLKHYHMIVVLTLFMLRKSLPNFFLTLPFL